MRMKLAGNKPRAPRPLSFATASWRWTRKSIFDCPLCGTRSRAPERGRRNELRASVIIRRAGCGCGSLLTQSFVRTASRKIFWMQHPGRTPQSVDGDQFGVAGLFDFSVRDQAQPGSRDPARVLFEFRFAHQFRLAQFKLLPVADWINSCCVASVNWRSRCSSLLVNKRFVRVHSN